jgi:hypothetical protein
VFGSEGPAAPRPILGALDEARANRVVEDVFDGRLQVIVVADHPGREPLAE